ncbi:MAG: MORN repeat protein [Syntrophorhabdus sp. PtaU1.Bin153]|nr:MAG: MORN repeat protein [Syntrophorhabdus sp. PtaU1.Bin153]
MKENVFRLVLGMVVFFLVFSTVAAQFVTPARAEPPCKVNDKDINAEYAGGCKDGFADGQGIAKGRDSYEGSFLRGDMHGKGVYIFATGGRYEGDFVSGEPTKGIMTRPDGTRYEGDFANRTFHGKGHLTFPSGRRYEGSFVNGEPTKGIETHPNGDRYEGDFSNGTFNGKGSATRPNGYYNGDFVNGKPFGKGVFRYTNGNYYEGDVADGKFNGKGILKYPNGDYYEGEFVNGLFHGKGRYTQASGDYTEGDFDNGKLVQKKTAQQSPNRLPQTTGQSTATMSRPVSPGEVPLKQQVYQYTDDDGFVVRTNWKYQVKVGDKLFETIVKWISPLPATDRGKAYITFMGESKYVTVDTFKAMFVRDLGYIYAGEYANFYTFETNSKKMIKPKENTLSAALEGQNKREPAASENPEQKETKEQRITRLVAKWSRFGVPKEMLSSQVQTHAGATVSGNICTLVELFDKMSGLQQCKRTEKVWICSQMNTDVMTGKTANAKYAFHDLRSTQGFVWLDRVVVNGQDIPSGQLMYVLFALLGW